MNIRKVYISYFSNAIVNLSSKLNNFTFSSDFLTGLLNSLIIEDFFFCFGCTTSLLSFSSLSSTMKLISLPSSSVSSSCSSNSYEYKDAMDTFILWCAMKQVISWKYFLLFIFTFFCFN